MSLTNRALSVASMVGAGVGALVIGGATAHRLALAKYRQLAAIDDGDEYLFGQLPRDRHYNVSASDGVELYVEEVGPVNAPVTVIAAHGWALQLGAWHFQRMMLAKDPHIRTVFFDQRSHGRSGRAAKKTCTMPQLAADLASVIAAAAPTGPLVLLGHSMGAMAIIELAALQPELFAQRVVGLGLISTSAADSRSLRRDGSESSSRLSQVNDANPLVRWGVSIAGRYPKLFQRARGASRDVVWLLTRSLGFADRGVPGPVVDYLDEMLSSTSLAVIADFVPTLFRHDQRAGLPVIAPLPVAIIVGDHDRMTPPAQAKNLAESLPHSTITIAAPAGHMVLLEQPAAVNAALADLLGQVR